ASVLSDDCTRRGGVDCEGDSLIGEPTVLIVGGGASFDVEKVWLLQIDENSNGRPDPGDIIRYVLRSANVGSAGATDVLLEDEVPEGSSYVAETLTVNGAPVSDADDVDPGSVVEETIRVRRDLVASGFSFEVGFSVLVGDVSVLTNQGVVIQDGRRYLSDGDPSIAGAQPTRTVIDFGAPVATVYLEAVDRSGGVIEPSDPIRYRITVVNDGGVDLASVGLELERESVFDVGGQVITSPPDAQLQFDNPPTWTASIPAGSQRSFYVDADLLDTVEQGRAFTAIGRVDALGVQSEPIELVMGGGVGSSTLTGRVFLERGERNGVFDLDRDEPIDGFTVALVPEGAELQDSTRANADLAAQAIRTVRTGADGRYQTSGVPAGRYRLIATSNSGTVFAEQSEAFEVASGLTEAPGLAVDPSGIIYEVREGAAIPVEGAQVFLVDENTDVDVDPQFLAAGQQGQITSGQGFYRFDLRAGALPGNFRIRIAPPSSTLFFPSGLRPPVGANADNPLGTPAPEGPASVFDFPQPEDDSTYYLRFEIEPNSEDVTNNHIPLDRLSDAIRLTKQVNRRRASVGEVLTYTITITNPLDAALTTEAVGARLVDIMPLGLQWANDSEAARTVVVDGEVVASERLAVARRTSRSVEFAPMGLPARSTTTVRYYAIVGIRAEGEVTNNAELRNASNVAISNRGSASFRVVDDPIFDQGTVLGRVFCDDDGNGVMSRDEVGLPGARVYLDTGFYVDTDASGKYHFRGVRPGRHVIKADLNTVPPGSANTTERVRDFILTRGLLSKIDFGVRCGWESFVVAAAGGPEPGGSAVEVLVDTSLPGVSFDGVAQDVLVVDAVVGNGEDAPDFDRGTTVVDDGAKLKWHIRSPMRADIARWSISIFADSGERQEVWRISGEGAPPKRVVEEVNLETGVPFLYRLAVVTKRGELSE
ncbi:MAG: hypothetical protein AAF658_06365, partial [Myxococcota bacterium]